MTNSATSITFPQVEEWLRATGYPEMTDENLLKAFLDLSPTIHGQTRRTISKTATAHMKWLWKRAVAMRSVKSVAYTPKVIP